MRRHTRPTRADVRAPVAPKQLVAYQAPPMVVVMHLSRIRLAEAA